VRFEGISAEASLSFSQFRMLAAQSRLAGFFGARPADVPLIPNYEKRARQGKPTAIFNTEIRALE
jgi:adhesin transport system outer membrane protein